MRLDRQGEPLPGYEECAEQNESALLQYRLRWT